MTSKWWISIVGLLLGLWLFSSMIFVITETQRGVKLRFGEVVKSDLKPGLHWKIPFSIENVRRFDARILTLDAKPERYLTLDTKPLVIDAYAKWRIVNVKKYYTATNGEEFRAHGLLGQRINDGLRNEVGKRDMHEVVSGKRDELMEELKTSLNALAKDELGVEIIDVRVKQVDLPKDVRQSVFNRMNTEREREAREHRSRGQELAEGIRASADRDQIVIESEAYRDAEAIRGEGDAKATAIYAQAYNKDREFYAFWRSLKAYEQTFANKSDVLLLKPDSDFFKYLNQQTGR